MSSPCDPLAAPGRENAASNSSAWGMREGENLSDVWQRGRHAHPDLAVALLDFECPQILLRRAVRDLAGAQVETRAMPRAFHLPVLDAALGERAEAVRAEFLQCAKLAVDAGDEHHR